MGWVILLAALQGIVLIVGVALSWPWWVVGLSLLACDVIYLALVLAWGAWMVRRDKDWD